MCEYRGGVIYSGGLRQLVLCINLLLFSDLGNDFIWFESKMEIKFFF